MKLTEIQDLIKFVAKSGVSEVELETKEVKIVIKTNSRKQEQQFIQTQVATPVQQVITATPQQVIQQTTQAVAENKTPTSDGNDESKYITIKSPMIGTFYRTAGPDKPQFVSVGDEVDAGKVVCIIEAMKLFNEIESDIKGKIIKVLVNDATPVEYDQPLFLVDPS